jgi:pre-rRNA-processing protein TSR1
MSDAAAAAAAGSGGCSAAVPLVVFGLLQHEAKLSVLNFGLKKVQGYSESIRNKEELLFVTGVRR